MSFTQLRVFSSFWSILEFLINFLPFGNPLGIFEIFFFTKLCVVQWGSKLHVVQPPDVFLPLHFSPMVTNRFFFFSFSSSPSSLHIIPNSLTSIFSLYKTLPLSHSFCNLIPLSQISSSETLSLSKLFHFLYGTQVQENFLLPLQ